MSRLTDIWNSLRFPAEVLAIECFYMGNTVYYQLAHLKRKGAEVELLATENLTSPEEMAGKYPKDVPLVLIFTGKKVLSKKVRSSSGQEDNEMISAAFPNVTWSNLLFHIEALNEEESVVSAVRRDMVEEELQKFGGAGGRVIDVAVGSYTVWSLFKKQQHHRCHWGYHIFDRDRAEVQVSEEPEDVPVSLFGESISAGFAIPFLYGLTFLASRTYFSGEEELKKGRVDWQYYTWYKKALLAGGAFIFIVLLLSFLVYNHYFTKNREMEQLTRSYDEQMLTVRNLKGAYERKQQFLQVNGSESSSFSRMSDEIAATVPKGVALQKMSFNPLEKRLKKENLVRFYRNSLSISGEAENYNYFRQWLHEINTLPWVSQVEIMGYQENDSHHQADFAIRIDIAL